MSIYEPIPSEEVTSCPICSRPHRFDRPCPTDLSVTRPSWDEYFLEIAIAVARRADCRRRQASCVIVKDHRIVSTGYNGAPSGQPGCLAGFCPRGLLSYEEIGAHSSYSTGPGRCIAVHAEANAIIYARGEDIRGATIYMFPGSACPDCAKLLAGAGIARAVWITPEREVSEMFY